MSTLSTSDVADSAVAPAHIPPRDLPSAVADLAQSPTPVVSQESPAIPVQAPQSSKVSTSKAKVASSEPKSKAQDPFADAVPSVTPVVLADLLMRLFNLFVTYLIITPEQARAAALWTVHTHMLDAAEVSPIAIINAPERACAKTLFQTILARLVRRPLAAANASMSALFRAIGKWGVTLLIDEADTFMREQREMHGMVNAGYQRGGAVIRSEPAGDSYEPVAFPVFGPKSIAGIALERHLHDATMSRGIHFNMRRKRADEKVQRLRDADESMFSLLRSDLARASIDYIEAVKAARPDLPAALSDRAQDNWEPLLAIAIVAGPDWFAYATEAAVSMSALAKEPASAGNDLLADVHEVLEGWRSPTIKTTDLIEKLQADPDMGWNTYNRGHPLTPRQLAKLLSAYDIKPKTVRQPKCPLNPNGSTPKGYEVADFKDAFDRYLNETQKSKKEVAATTQPMEDDSDLY